MIRFKTVIPVMAAFLLLTGCNNEVQIFEDPSAKYQADALSNLDLENDKYYIKEGTKFYEVYDCETSGGSGGVDNTRCAFYVGDYETKLPTYYKDELIACASKTNTIEDVDVERYSDTGYSIGVYGATWEDGYITFNLSSNTVEESDAQKKFENKRSKNIMIESINGQKVSADMLNKAGVFVGFEEGKDYNVTFWAGTYYGTATITADTHFFQSFEAYTLEDHSITKNGYIAIRMPEDAKSGYYYIDGEGMFRYVSEEKGIDLTSVDYNEEYFKSEEDQLAAYSQQYNFSIETIKTNASIVATFDKTSLTEDANTDTVKMMVTSPDGTRQMFEPDIEKGTITANYTTLSPGKWMVNITPQSIVLTSIEVVDNTAEQEKTENTYTFNISEQTTGLEFYVNYEGEGEVTAQVIGPDGQSHDLESGKLYSGDLGYIYSWANQGEYTIHVYHYPDTKITGADHTINTKNKEEEIITIEE